eukprot:XP_011677501.1 PREDICTED: centromere protein I-like [Strongylocentrotus purpuratus]
MGLNPALITVAHIAMRDVIISPSLTIIVCIKRVGRPIELLNDLVLEPLRTLFFSSSVYLKCQVLYTLTDLLRNYVTYEISQYHETASRQKVEETEEVLVSSVFSVREAYFDPMNTVKKLVEFVDGLFLVALQLHQHHSLFLHHTLTFFEQVALLYKMHGVVFSQMPAKMNCYWTMFGIDPTACSRMCQIICKQVPYHVMSFFSVILRFDN